MIKMKSTRRKRLMLAVVMLPFLLLSAQAFGQSAGVSGTVTDATGAVLPGTTVTATNTDTGVKTTTTSNSAGIYNFASLAPGTYMVSSEIPGFQTLKKTDIKLEVGSRLRVNFEMQVSGIATQVEVTTSAADLLLESTATTGTVMNDKVAKDLPLVGNDVMQLVNVMGGVVKAENTIFGNSNQTFAGVMANDINITRDGISVNDSRYSSGIVSPARMNPEMIGEFKLILTPVDAEMGRGAGQVQVLTKSGGNEYHGSGVWSNINTAMDAKEWNDNRLNLTPMWKNVNQYTLSGGGPIIKNKTFFFASWDQNIARKREPIRSNVLTPCARKGIYRWFPGWIPAASDATIGRGNNSQSRPSVVSSNDGTPLKPTDNRDGTPYTVVPGGTADGMHWMSVLGQLNSAAQLQIAADPINCSQYSIAVGGANGITPDTNWNTYRKAYDLSGFTDRFSTLMPMPNNYLDGDGLNTADLRWTRTTHGEDTVYGSGMDSARKSITVKIDHNLNQSHRLSGTFSYEKSANDGAEEPTWPPPNGFGGYIDPETEDRHGHPHVYPEAHAAQRISFWAGEQFKSPNSSIDNPVTGKKLQALLLELLPTDSWTTWKGLPLNVEPGAAGSRFDHTESNPAGGRLPVPATWGSNDYRYTYSDTLTWTKGSHSFKFGADFRLTKAQANMNGVGGFGDDPIWMPNVFGGSAVDAPYSGLAGQALLPGLVGTSSGSVTGNYAQAYGLMDYIAGSIRDVRQYYFAKDSTATAWSDPSTAAGQTRKLDMTQREFSFFLKDDWKVSSDLTLNLGVRYEYYGVPWMPNGMTVGVVGGQQNIFGKQEGGFDSWLRGVPSFNGELTQQHFIGPGSPNPDEMLFQKDLNNFGPAVGFAWQLPWFGKGKTTLRGGYQVSYSQISRIDPNGGFLNVAGSQPGLIYPHTYGGDTAHPYLDLAHMQDYTPTSKFWDGTVVPLSTRPLTDGTQTASVYDPNVRSPYIQSLTLALTRQIGSSLTVDVRYIGTLSRKQIGTVNLNTNNWVNNGLKQAFDAARAGGESALLDQLMPAGKFWAYSGPSGAAQLRGHYLTSTALANGNYNELANVLKTSNGNYGDPSTVQGGLIRRSGLGENFIYTNRQFATANWLTNRNHTNYHSLQVQITMRPTHGLNFQATYTWSRNLGDRGDNTDPLDKQADYGILGTSRSHTLTTYGTYNVPIGKLRDSKAWVRKLAEGWQLSWVHSATSGLPYSVTSMYTGNAINSLYGGSSTDLVNPALFNAKDGHVTWDPTQRYGLYFGNKYVQVNDPQCASVATSLQGTCRTNLKALALASDPSQIVFRHAQPGVRGNFDPNSLTGPGRWSLDMAISKNIVVKEGKSINFRVDVNNILNHPTPSGTAPSSYDQRTYAAGSPISDLNAGTGTPFGYMGYKVSHRVFSAKLRMSF